MLTLKLLVKDNWRTMVRVEDTLSKQVGDAVRETADGIVADIRSSWSGSRQTMGSGNPPAIDTGLLDESVIVDDQGRDAEGHFARSEDAKVFYVRVDTSEGEPNGYNYAQALEDPAYYNLPFLAPALERAEGYYTSNIKRFVRL